MTLVSVVRSLDEIDRQIVYELDRNSRQNISRLAHKLKLSRDRINYRIGKLVDSRIIRRFTVTLNPYNFGMVMHKVYMRVDSNAPRVEQLLNMLHKHPRTYWVAECDGKWDILFATLAHNPPDFRDLQRDIFSGFNDIIISFHVYTVVDATIYPRRHLVGATAGGVYLGGIPTKYPLDKVDFRILRFLSHDARMSAVDLALRLDCSPAIARSRVERLEQKNIITGYQLELDLEALGLMFFKVQLDLGTGAHLVEKQLKKFCDSNSHATYLIRQIGEREIEIEMEVSSYGQLMHFMREVRQLCAGVVRDIEISYIRKHVYRVGLGYFS